MPTLGSNNPFPSILVAESTTPASPAAGHQRIFIGSTDNALHRVNSSGAVRSIENGLVSISVLTSTATNYVVPAGIYRLRVRVQGPGGGGGGGDQGAAQSGAGAGGGAGGYAERIFATTPGASFTYAVGTGGTGGAAGNNAGNPGSANTVFDSTGVAVTGNLGNGGNSMAAGTTLAAAAGGAGGAASNGTINITGQTGTQSIRTAVGVFWQGCGGNSMLGLGGAARSSGAGTTGTGYGSGGGGGSEFAASSDRAGGDGANGVIIIEEYN